MIALAFSALIALYLLIPHALFRYFLGLFVPVKAFQGPKTEELTRAVVTLTFIFILALYAVWRIPGLKSHPFFFDDAPDKRVSDYVIVASSLYNETVFKEYGPRFWEALSRVFERQGRMLVWYYTLCTFFAVLFGWASKNYGKFKDYWAYAKFADFYLMPHISQWHVLLTPFTFPDPKTLVRADVLMTDNTLYSGEVIDHFVDQENKLSGLFLKNPSRFDRVRYLKEKEDWGMTRPTKTYWRSIPSAKLYLVADKIVNLNLNYEPPNVQGVKADVVERYLAKYQNLPNLPSVTISPGPAAMKTSARGARELQAVKSKYRKLGKK